MKKLSIIAALVILATGAFAQSVDMRRKIEVDGMAEREITPDIINVTISLKEYMDGKNKVSISTLERQLETALQQAGVAKDDIRVNNLSAYNYATEKKKNPDFMASKQYGIRFKDLNKYNQILAKVDAKGIQSTYIESYDYSKMADVKKELKVQALMAAKEKASYMVAALGEKLGVPLNIIDNGDGANAPIQQRAAMYSMKASADAVPESDLDARRIKITSNVHVVFEIK
jgi:uncharacterized protein